MNYRDLTHVRLPTGWKKPPIHALRLYPPHVLTITSEAEARRFIEAGWLWQPGTNNWTYTVHVLAWLRSNVGRVDEDWEIASAREPEHVRVYFRLKHHAMMFKLVFA